MNVPIGFYIRDYNYNAFDNNDKISEPEVNDNFRCQDNYNILVKKENGRL